MINSLENSEFFRDIDVRQLQELGLWHDSNTTPAKLAFAGLMLAPIMEIDLLDNATSATEFQTIEQYLRSIEWQFEIATESDLEDIGTDMGLLPMVKGNWTKEKFKSARGLLAATLERLTEKEAHNVKSAIAKAMLDVARAGSPHIISFHGIDSKEGKLIHEIARDLQLHTTAEGLNLLGKSGD
jgi:hypothetical protein